MSANESMSAFMQRMFKNDQDEASLTNLAVKLAFYQRALLTAGFAPAEALHLVTNLQSALAMISAGQQPAQRTPSE